MDELNNQNVKIIKHANFDDIRYGYYVIREREAEYGGVVQYDRREGVAHHVDAQGRWCTDRGVWLVWPEDEGVTLTIRRPVKKLPNSSTSVIVANDGHEAIEATMGVTVWRTSDAVLGADGRWHGVWRRAGAWGAVASFMPEHITPDTWKVDGE